MKLTIRYGGQEYVLRDTNWSLAELALVQQFTGLMATEFEAGLTDKRGNALALAAGMWLAARRSGDLVKWADFETRLTAPLATIEIATAEDDAPAGEMVPDGGTGADEVHVGDSAPA